MSLYNLLNSKDNAVKQLAKEIQSLQKSCEHEYGPESQNYNIYSKHCKKCGYVHSEEY